MCTYISSAILADTIGILELLIVLRRLTASQTKKELGYKHHSFHKPKNIQTCPGPGFIVTVTIISQGIQTVNRTSSIFVETTEINNLL